MQQTRGAQPTAWVGWIICAVAVMVISGIFHVISGIVAILDDDYYVVASRRLIVHADYTAWGWAHIVVGVVVVLAGCALLVGKLWARVVAVVVAVCSAILNLAFLAAAPFLSTLVIAFDVLVIYAVTVHGHEMEGRFASTDPEAARYTRGR
jgi:hypothetical protein